MSRHATHREPPAPGAGRRRARRVRPARAGLGLVLGLALVLAAVPAVSAPAPASSDRVVTASWWDRLPWLRPRPPRPRPAPAPAPQPSPAVPAQPAPTRDPEPTSSPDPAPGNGSGPLLGVAVGNDPAALRTYESWLGREADLVAAYGGFERLPGSSTAWDNFDGSLAFQTNQWRGSDRPILWSVPLIPGSGEGRLSEAAAGRYDEHYRRWARGIAAYREDRPVYVRTGWEFNGGWFPWTVTGGREADYRGAFRRFVQAFRSVDPDLFRFEWNVNIGRQDGNDPELSYPGDDVVDVVGMDFYQNADWPRDPVEAWNWNVTQPFGLQWHQDFARRHGKRTAYSEWGVRSGAAAPYVRLAHAWFERHDVVYQVYWDSDEAYPGRLSRGQYPATGRVYRELFR